MSQERFWSKVQTGDGCWLWTGFRDRDGYGIYVESRGVTRRAHRVSYQWEHGPVPKGRPLDHICHDPLLCSDGVQCVHRSCVRPSHLRLASPKENSKRTAKGLQTHCVNGHEFTEQNTYIKRNGCRQCRACHVERERRPEHLKRRAEAQRRYQTRKRGELE